MYDAIIVGARCGGSPLAMLLARRGHRVLVVDRDSLPADTVSTHYMHQAGLARLQAWGLLDEVIAAGTPASRSMHYAHRDVTMIGFADPIDGIDAVYCPRRVVLDEILVNAARRAGAEVVDNFTVTDLLWDGGRVVGVRGRTASGGESQFRGALVVGADGAHSTVAKRVRAETYNVRPAAGFTYYSYFEGLDWGMHHRTGHHGRWMGSWPTNGGHLVAVMARKEHLREFRQDVPAQFQATLDDVAPELGEQMRDSGRALEPFIPMRYPDNFYRQAAGDGWALIGDAGYHKDPLTGWGMTDAFLQAEMLADAITEGLSGRSDLSAALAEYGKRRDEESAVLYDYTTTVAELGELPPFFQAVLEAAGSTEKWTRTMLGWIAGGVADHEIFSPDGLQALYDDAGVPEERRVYDPTA
jgi:2-polyprenyl-6-methoxyphenol hydroxylase-like FAD-dependent oxidoreductase